MSWAYQPLLPGAAAAGAADPTQPTAGDTGTLSEAVALAISTQDSGTLFDSYTQLAALRVPDEEGTLAESTDLNTGGVPDTPVASSDTGTLVESLVLDPAGTGGDAGTGSEGVPGIAVSGPTDSGAGTETAAIDTAGADTGSLAESGSSTAEGAGTDTGTLGTVPGLALDGPTDSAALVEVGVASQDADQATSDSGVAAESSTLAAALAPADTATSGETVALALGPTDAFGQADGVPGIALDGAADTGTLAETTALAQQGTAPTDTESATLSEGTALEQDGEEPTPAPQANTGNLPMWIQGTVPPLEVKVVPASARGSDTGHLMEGAAVEITDVASRAPMSDDDEEARILAALAAIM